MRSRNRPSTGDARRCGRAEVVHLASAALPAQRVPNVGRDGTVTDQTPLTTLDARYSEDRAEATPWPEAVVLLEQAALFWVSSVRPDRRPHVTPVVAVWMSGALYFSSGPEEQKSRNLAANRSCAVTTGCNTWDEGFDIVLHGEVEIVRDVALLQKVADAFLAKYGNDWSFEVGADGTFRGPGVALVYQLKPTQALGFGKGSPFSHTLWDFSSLPRLGGR